MGTKTWLFSICILLIWWVPIPNVSSASFLPVDNLLIDCGGNDTLKLVDGRTFRPDLGSWDVVLSPISHNVVWNSARGMPSLYKTARVFTVPSMYTFGVKKAGRHWLRLHFCAIASPNYNLTSAVFSVMANEVSLLHEFSMEYAKWSSGLLKEYVVDLVSNSMTLSLTFSPSKGSVAFINGIEVVSVPTDQFPSVAAAIPVGPPVEISTQVAFQTSYRINVGGPLLNSENDTLWRIWEPDHPFLINAAAAHSVSVSPSSIKYPAGVSAEIAPNWVYATAQEMANANVGDQKFNISWVFGIDPGFRYLIRLHFCDIISKALNNLVFNVYINNQSALSSFDISSKTMELSAACFVDFITNDSVTSEKILIQIGPPNMMNAPANAILNGLEIMKLSNSGNSFYPSYSSNSISSNHSKKRNSVVLAVASCLGGSIFLGICIAAFCLYFHPRPKEPNRTVSWLPLPTHVGHSESKISTGSFASLAPSSGLGRVLAFSEIREATKNFDESLVLGVGGFGKVYKGVLDNGILVAVKRGNPRSQQGLVEFRTEIQMLSKLRHRHLVSLIGYCEELNEMILVYEYMAGGPLRKHIYGSNLPPLSWKQRLEICIGAAKGLHYLHTGAAETIIHRDVKTTNILLDENLTAKVADFGLSKLGPTLDQTHVSTAVKGSFGYLDPEYFRRQQLTEKSDVYSFGVVLMEVLCARPAINPALPREQVNIAEWAMHWQKRGHLEQIIDPHLMGSVNLESLRKYGETAEKCLAEQGSERPTMGDVLWNLEYALQLQESSTQTIVNDNSTSYIPDLPDWIPQIESVDQNNEGIVNEQDSEMGNTPSEVFSQLMDPKGR